MVIGNSKEEGVTKAKIQFKGKYEAKLEIPGVGGYGYFLEPHIVQVSMKSYLPSKEIYLSCMTRQDFFDEPCKIKKVIFNI